jgi:protein-S-isoprenylcysteine O-methyltransferase Ste14
MSNKSKPATSGDKTSWLNILLPSMYFVPVAAAFFLPKNFGFGYPFLVPVALTIGLAGLILWIIAMVNLGNSLAVMPGADQLIIRGVYKYLRHPIYIGIIFTIFGLTVASGSVFGLIFLVVVVIPLNITRAYFEEKALLKKFGKEYETYRSGTFF